MNDNIIQAGPPGTTIASKQLKEENMTLTLTAGQDHKYYFFPSPHADTECECATVRILIKVSLFGIKII